MSEYQEYSVSARDREPLIAFMIEALQKESCTIIYRSPPDRAPFRITFETPGGERHGIIAYAFLANHRETKNRPEDEWRFQLKYGSKDGREHELYQDPYGLYTTLLIGISPNEDFFVGADPVLHSPTKFFISVEFKQRHVDSIKEFGWFAWERESRGREGEPVEVLIGGTKASFLRYVLFERSALGEDQGHRQLIAEQSTSALATRDLVVIPSTPFGATPILAPHRAHRLAVEFEMTEQEVLELIASKPRLKMATRGLIAELKLRNQLSTVSGIERCIPIETEGSPVDLEVFYRGRGPITIQCKNALRNRTADGLARVDLQRTRTSKSDPCSRYYRRTDFTIVAACLHALTQRWEFSYALTGELDPHPKCKGRLSNNVKVDERWYGAEAILHRAVAALS